MGRLEKIVEQMESNQLPLEEMLERYEEGIKLVKLCSDKLGAAEKRIEIITRNASGKPQVVEFEGTVASTGGSTQAPGQSVPTPKPGKPLPKASPQPSDDISLF